MKKVYTLLVTFVTVSIFVSNLAFATITSYASSSICSGRYEPPIVVPTVDLDGALVTDTIVQFTNGTAPDYRNDDGSSVALSLPFTFYFYGDSIVNSTFNNLYINNNGNITFNQPYSTFSAAGFPSNDYVMIAPFWGDADTRDVNSGLVYMRRMPHYAIIKWDGVGYFNSQADKKNSFMLILTDGTSSILPNGFTTAFIYGDMQWTTGSASQGINGFGGVPATVGVNKGDGTNFLQYGLFDNSTSNYDGSDPTTNNDGVNWLDNKCFYFNANNSSSNLPPIVSSGICDTINVYIGNTLNYSVKYYAPETNQNVTIQVIPPSNSTGFSSTIDSSIPHSPTANISFVSQTVGLLQFKMVAFDNGTPALYTDTITYTINVLATTPIAVDDNSTTPLNTPVTFNVLVNDIDTAGTINQSSIDLNTSLAGIQPNFSNAFGTWSTDSSGFVTYTPANGFTGNATATYTVDNFIGGTSNLATITVIVSSSNTPPVAVNDNATTPINTPVIIDVLNNDNDFDGFLFPSTIDLNTSLAGIQSSITTVQGTWSLSLDTSFNVIYTPTNNFSGTATTNYTVNDNDGFVSNVATITVIVDSSNNPPSALNDSATTQVNTPVIIDVLNNDTDFDGFLFPSTIDLNTSLAGIQSSNTTVQGTWSLSLDTSYNVIYTPTNNFSGTATLDYTVNDNLNAISNIATIAVEVQSPNILSVSITSTNPSICAGQNVTFTATAENAGTGFTFQWFKNGQPIVGANSATYSSTSLANGDSIYCYVVTSLSQTAQSNSITVTVNTSVAPTINITASQTTICSGTTVFLNATATNGGNNPTYQWFKNGNVLAGFTSDTISSNSFANNDIITCVLTSNAECASPSVVTSNSISFVVNASPNLVVNPVAAAVCAGSPSTTLTASGATTYSWSPATGLNSTTTAQVIASPTLSTTYTVTGTSNGCIATAQAVVTYTNSGTASLTIAATQTSICTGNNVIFTAIPSYGGTTPTYQWKKNGVNIAGAIAYIYSSSSLQNNDVITCTMVSNDPCVTTTNATSNSITMTVNASSTPTVSILSSGSTICAGSNVTFTATPAFGGNAPTYVWKINGVIASTSGATFNSNSLNNNDTVRCYMTSNAVCAIPATVNSNAVIMSVSPLLTPTIDITASQNNICSGTSVTFTASITNGGAAPTYQWQKNNINISGATSATYSSSTLGNNDAITCILTSNATCANPVSTTSNSISMVVTQSGTASVLAASSAGSIICANENSSVIFIATPTNGGSSPTYQWYRNGSLVLGQTANLYLPPLINNNDSVRCVMTSNSTCVPQTVVSSPLVVMTVLPNVIASVSITSTATNICQGTRVIFTATAGAGITNPLYQWRINGINIPQETGSTFNSTTLNNGDDVSALLFSATECLSSNNVASNNITMSVNQSNFGLGFTANTQTPSASSQFNVQFTNNTTITANKSFIWYYGDGTNYTGLIPQDHFYPSNGVYSVALKVVDTQTGCVDSLSRNNYITCAGSNNNCNQTITLTPTANSVAGCQGGSVILSCATNASNPTYQWNKNGIPMGGETQSSYTATSQGNYTVTVYNNGGCPVTSNGKQITFNSPSSPAPVISQTGVFQSCIQNSVTLTVNSGYNSYLWSTGETTQSINVSESGLYSVMGTNTLGCNRQSNPMAVNNSAVAAPEICMVFVDSILNKNVIVWEKPVTTEIDSFIVFKETSQQSVYQRVGGQPYAALSEFTDITSNPSQQADVYKLAIKDNCGNLTLPSFYHRTIYLQITPNIGTSRVLSWNNNLGYIAQNYVINRGQIGSMHPIDTIAGTENTYTDYPPSTAPNDTVYRIDIVYSEPCAPSLVQMQNDFQTLAQRVRSTSNTGGNLTILNIGNSTLERSLFEVNLKLFPNPNNGNFVLQNADGSMLEKGQVEVFDLAGRKVIETTVQSNGIIEMNEVSNGVYYVKYSNAKSSKTLKMMVQKGE